MGMNEVEVLKILGEPMGTRTFTTGKAWIPYYYGPDTSRVEWNYPGVGRVIFSMNRYTGTLKVVEVSRE
jgi:hypothetical protein